MTPKGGSHKVPFGGDFGHVNNTNDSYYLLNVYMVPDYLLIWSFQQLCELGTIIIPFFIEGETEGQGH